MSTLRNSNRYIKTVINFDKMNNDFGGAYRFVAQRPYKGKSEAGLEPGATVTLQIIKDTAPPVIDKETGMEMDNNVFQTFDATIVGTKYPLPFAKGDYVALNGFIPEASYYINFNFILRFKEIKLLKAAQKG